MHVIPYDQHYLAAIASLFYATVHTINRRDYTPEQLQAWANGTPDLNAWHASFVANHTLLALHDDTLVGFGDMQPDGYLNRLYVHHAYQGQGIATALCDALESASPHHVISVHASVTAKAFFEHRGYCVLQEQQVQRGGITLTNFRMAKRRGQAQGK